MGSLPRARRGSVHASQKLNVNAEMIAAGQYGSRATAGRGGRQSGPLPPRLGSARRATRRQRPAGPAPAARRDPPPRTPNL